MFGCCQTRKKRKHTKRLRKESLHKKRTTNVIEPYEDCKTQAEFTKLFMSEAIVCGPCGKAFILKEDEIVAYCGGCYKFLHCGIAGKCIGPNCSYTIKGEKYSQSWCIKCVPQTVMINITNNCATGDCLCQECIDDIRTPKVYKKKI